MATRKPKNLGKAEGIDTARKTKGPKPTFMQEMTEDDAKEQKQSASAKLVKEAHGYARELVMRLSTCRLATSTSTAIAHDLERVLELCDSVQETVEDALKALDR